MSRIDCRVRMNEALIAIDHWGAEHADMFLVGARRECLDTWTRNYAIIELHLDVFDASPYIDGAQALADLRKVASDVFGSKFKIEHGFSKTRVARKPGQLYCHFHLHEIEIYRVNRAKKDV